MSGCTRRGYIVEKQRDSGTEFASIRGVLLRVMTYNIKGQSALLHSDHIRKIAGVIREAGADIVGLQEVHRGTWQSRKRDQVAELEEASGMKAYFGPSFGDAYGNAILTNGTVEEQHVEPLPGGGEPRSLFATTIDAGGVRLHAYVTHLAAWGRFGSSKRLPQAEAVAKRVQQSTLPFVLMGDFNAKPSSAELRVFLEGKFVGSCFKPDVITHRGTKQCLDYIFVDPGWEVRNARVIELGPSDHWPLIAELEKRISE